MRRFSLICLFLSISIVLTSQTLDEVDLHVIDYEDLSFRTPEKLAEQINLDFKTDLEKARAIYAWIGMNIGYDIESYRKGTNRFAYTYQTKTEKESKEIKRIKQVADFTFKNKKGVCDGYANLFKNLCDLTGLKCEIVSGYAKNRIDQIGRSPGERHSWNLISINGDLKLVDATWGAGVVMNNEFYSGYTPIYFDCPPEKFHLNHYPDKDQWLLHKISPKEYLNGPLIYSNYLNTSLEIISPKTGTIDIKNTEIIKLQIRSDEHPYGLTYKFNDEKYSNRLVFEKHGQYYEAEIVLPKLKQSNLILYYKNSGIVAYKLEYKRS